MEHKSLILRRHSHTHQTQPIHIVHVAWISLQWTYFAFSETHRVIGICMERAGFLTSFYFHLLLVFFHSVLRFIVFVSFELFMVFTHFNVLSLVRTRFRIDQQENWRQRNSLKKTSTEHSVHTRLCLVDQQCNFWQQQYGDSISRESKLVAFMSFVSKRSTQFFLFNIKEPWCLCKWIKEIQSNAMRCTRYYGAFTFHSIFPWKCCFRTKSKTDKNRKHLQSV